MTKEEFKAAVKLAKSGPIQGLNIDILMGFGLRNFQPVAVSLATVAECLRWQCLTFAGTWDDAAMDEVFYFKDRFIIVG